MVIGKNTTSKSSLVLLPDFVGQSSSYAQSWCSSHGIKVNVSGGSGSVVSQSAPAGSNVEDVKSITLTIGGNTSTDHTNKTEKTNSKEEKTSEPKEEEKDTGNNNNDNSSDPSEETGASGDAGEKTEEDSNS